MPSKAWNEEFAVLSEIQDDRMSMHHNVTCQERCVSTYATNTIVLGEKTCMESCLWKLFQTSLITNINYQKFSEFVAKGGQP